MSDVHMSSLYLVTMTSLSRATFYILCLIIGTVLLLYRERENLNGLAKSLLDNKSSRRGAKSAAPNDDDDDDDLPDHDAEATIKKPEFSAVADHGGKGLSRASSTNNSNKKPLRGFLSNAPRRRRRPDDKIIYFLHIHKSGGTSFCSAARMNHLSVSKTNCNVQPDQRCCGRQDSLSAQQQFAHTSTYDLVASEKEMYDAMDTANFDYVVILRRSFSRYLSHWRHVQRLDYTEKEEFDTWWKAQPDNYSTRMICGTRCMDTPKFRLSRQDFQYTLSRLAKFDSILFLESFEASFEEFAEKHSWTDAKLDWKHKSEEKNDDDDYIKSWDPLMSTLDDTLYAFAERLLLKSDDDTPPPGLEDLPLDQQQSLDRYFEQGPARSCDSPCCATKCSTYR